MTCEVQRTLSRFPGCEKVHAMCARAIIAGGVHAPSSSPDANTLARQLEQNPGGLGAVLGNLKYIPPIEPKPPVFITDATRECAARTDRRWRGRADQSLLDFLLESGPSWVSMAHYHSLLPVDCEMMFAPLFEFQLDGQVTLDADRWKFERVFREKLPCATTPAPNAQTVFWVRFLQPGGLRGGAVGHGGMHLRGPGSCVWVEAVFDRDRR